MNRRAFLASLMLTILVSFLTTSAIFLTNKSRTSETSIFVSPLDIVVNVGQTFRVDINISEAIDLYGWEFKLSWNSNLLEAINVTENGFLGSAGDTYFVSKIINTEGYLLVGCTMLRNITGVHGNGTLATVEFRAKRLGSCTLGLYDTKLVNSFKQLTAHTDIDGTVTTSGCVTVTVRFADYYPVEGGTVILKKGEAWIYLGVTNASGQVERCDLSLSGNYIAYAYYPNTSTLFGSSFLPVDENGDGNATICGNYEITPPVLEILSPQNMTYTNSSVPLTFTVNDYSPISWIGYSIDNQLNATITGNTTLNSLTLGPHNIIVYANDTYGNMASSDKVYFTISTHDIAVTSVVPYKTVVGQGYSMNINVTVENQGNYTESFNVTVFYDDTVILPDGKNYTTVTLTRGNSTTLTFTWNTTGVAKGVYTITAYAHPVPDETDTTDNTYTDGIVQVVLPGDINADGKVDMKDIGLLCIHYGAEAGDPRYVANYDVNCDGKIDMKDIGICCLHYGEEDP